MLGSAVDADDATQETMIRAWKSLDKFDGRASLRTWLYRIATNVCLDEIAKRVRRARPMEESSSGSPSPDELIHSLARIGSNRSQTIARFPRMPIHPNAP